MSPELRSTLRQSPRVVACDDDRLVLKLEEPDPTNPGARISTTVIIITTLGAFALAISLLFPTLSRAGLVAMFVLAGAVVAQALLFENTLVALRGSHQITLERRSLLSGRKSRTAIVDLEDITRFEVRNRVDLVSDVNPYEGFEVVARKTASASALWWSSSKEIAEAVCAVLNDFRTSFHQTR